MPMLSDETLTSAQAGARLGVSTQTVQKWVDAGVLRAWRTVGGHRRVDAASVEALLRQRDNAPPPGAAAPGTSVMLVEDDPDAATILQAQVLHLLPGARLRVMADGFAALLEAGRELPDTLISDINLPGMDGLAMLRSLRAHPAAQAMRVVLVTHHSLDELQRFGALPPGVPVLRKPPRLDELRLALGLPVGAAP
jgi:excisionase family DNA binding protein